MERTGGGIGSRSLPRPRLLMTWEDWLTFGAALMTFWRLHLDPAGGL
jgi:hypothetical protein